LSRIAITDTAEMLRDQSMSASGKLHRSVGVDGQCPVWVAPALQAIFVIATVCQYSRVFPLPGSGLLANHERGLFTWRLPLAMMSSASKVPIG